MIPEFLKTMLEEQYGIEISNKIINGYNVERKVTLRVNTIKTTVENVKQEFKKTGIILKEVMWSDIALIIENTTKQDIEKLEAYTNGEIYLQSLSSMLPVIILDSKEKENILDMCAAPRWKDISNCKRYG